MSTNGLVAPVLALVLVGCTLLPVAQSAEPTSESPISTASAAEAPAARATPASPLPDPSPATPADPTATPSPPATPESVPSDLPDPAATPDATAWLAPAGSPRGTIKWHRIATSGLDLAVYLTGITTFRGQFVLTGAEGYVDDFFLGPAAWLSSDGTSWHKARIDRRPEEVAFSAPFVLADRILTYSDASIWTSVSGDDWHRLDNAVVGVASVDHLAAAGDRVVAFGGESTEWNPARVAATSADGVSWSPVTDEVGLHIVRGLRDVHTADGSAYAFVAANERGAFSDWELVDVIEVWRTSDGLHWSLLGELEGSRQLADISGIGVNDRGLVAVSFNERMAWFSADRSRWRRATQPPLRRIWPEFLAVGATTDAFVVTSGRYPASATGIFHEENVTGLTWLSADGDRWALQDDTGWDGREIDLLFSTDDALIGVGRDFTAAEIGAIWVAAFPDFGS